MLSEKSALKINLRALFFMSIGYKGASLSSLFDPSFNTLQVSTFYTRRSKWQGEKKQRKNHTRFSKVALLPPRKDFRPPEWGCCKRMPGSSKACPSVFNFKNKEDLFMALTKKAC